MIDQILVSAYQPKWLAGKNVSEMTYFCVEWDAMRITLTVSSINISMGLTQRSSVLRYHA